MVLILGDVSNLISAYVQPLKDAESSARTTSTSVGIRWDKTVLFRFVWFVFKRKKKTVCFVGKQIQVAKDCGVKLMTAFQRRFDPSFSRLQVCSNQ